MYSLIKKDYEAIKHSQYYGDYIENLGPVKKKFFLDILKSNDYEIVSITKNKLIGKATVILRGKGSYGGTCKFTFKVTKRNF